MAGFPHTILNSLSSVDWISIQKHCIRTLSGSHSPPSMGASSSSSKSNQRQQLLHSVSPACKETIKTPTQLQRFSERVPNSTTRLSFWYPHNQPLNFSPAPRTPQNFGSCSVERFDNVDCRMMTPRSKMVFQSSMSSMVKAMVDESIRVSRKAQASHESWLHSQEKLLTAWLNGLLKKPMKQPQPQTQPPRIVTQSCPTPTPSKIRSVRAPPTPEKFLAKPPVLIADSCLKDVCGLAELKQRLAWYMDATSVNDLVSSIFKIATCVDDGRLRMKENCAIITDVGLKNKAIKVMMNYNPVWLRLGLHVVLGYCHLAPLELLKLGLEKPINERTDEDFLKLVIEKYFFAHPGLAKTYAFHKQGYYEALGKVILKRFLLFVMTLDKIKKENTYPIDQGIDGLDGGSPLLFCRNSWVKSSRQALHELLSDVMYEEGDLVSHLAMLGYEVSHFQSPLWEYDFYVSNLMENIQDGVILCRLAQILCQDTSVLARIKLPCDYHKKNLHNCNVALEYFLQAGVPLKDEEGMLITAESVVDGDRENILSFLWSVFIELQMPLLISKENLKEEIFRIKGCEDTEMEMSLNSHGTMEMMLQWIKGVRAAYGKQVNDLKSLYTSWTYALYLIDFYVPGSVPHYLLKEVDQVSESSMDSDSRASLQKFKRARHIIEGILNIPEITEVIEEDTLYKDKNVIMIVTFLSAQLLTMKQKRENALLAIQNRAATKIQSCWRKHEHQSKYSKVRKATILIQFYYRGWLARKQKRANALLAIQNRAASKIQSYWRKGEHQSKFCKLRNATVLIQSYWRGWLVLKQKKANDLLAIQNKAATKIQCCWKKGHQSKYRQLKNATILIQSYFRMYRHRKLFMLYKEVAIIMESIIRMILALQQGRALHCINLVNHTPAAVPIMATKLFMLSEEVAVIMESIIRMILALQQGRDLHCTNPVNHTPAAVPIKAPILGWLGRKAFSKATKSAICIQAHWRGYKVRCNSQQQISALRAQIKTSASNVDKSHCLENRLNAALEALPRCKSLSSILHICNTLDLATQHSRRCCEKLVEVGAIDKILQVVRSDSSTSFEEVLKHALSVHALSVLSNIAGHQDLAPFIINIPESVNAVAEQLMRNNDQVFCKAAQVLKKLCAVEGGAEALHRLPLFIGRLMQLSQSLEKKLQTQKRNLDRLKQRACDTIVKMAGNKWKNMLLQHQLITELLQLIQCKPILGPCAKARIRSPKCATKDETTPAIRIDERK